MLALPLTSSFSLSSVPWDYVSGCSNCSSSQGPAVAWHTLSPLNTSSLLVFGGYLGPNSLISLPEQPDSAALVNIASITKRVWSTGVSLISASILSLPSHRARGDLGSVRTLSCGLL
ncbi:uncharacterized protein C8Q71DRAFT_289677 [Rhodofomes roseus]|uniref:Secreted protein n=1 Tax=Rhodofomes roseus TaxID=34475 RepID=A0ABQ8K3U3_9APHY|nr:uncharacterized protein C8Q71DRAFT_289677 [Rhodofomes roseus]KAH9831530.1 hypothetical protein C8Q71DRAFT_289677 [Rhodofomes roseus]